MNDDSEPKGARYGLTPEEKAAVGRRLDEIAATFDKPFRPLVNFPPPKNPMTRPGFVERALARRGLIKGR